MPFLDSAVFLEVADKMAKQAHLLAVAIEAANVAGVHGPVYDQVSDTNDRDVETNSFLSILQRYDVALTRRRVFRTIKKWGTMIDAMNKSLVIAADPGGPTNINDYLTEEGIRVSPWFSIIHKELKLVHLNSLNVFPEGPDNPGDSIELATITIQSWVGATGYPPAGLTGLTGVTGVSGDLWPDAVASVVFNPDYVVGGDARLGVGEESKFQEFSATDPTVYNAGGGTIYVEVDSDPTTGAIAGIDQDLVLQFIVLDEDLVQRTRYLTLPQGTILGTQVILHGGRYLQINEINHIFGGDLDLVLKVKVDAERTISL